MWLSAPQASCQLNGMFTSDGVNDMMEGKDYQRLEVLCSFICEYVYKAFRYFEDAQLKNVDMLYSELLLEVFSRSLRVGPCVMVMKSEYRSVYNACLPF